jgi:hypothetical protein
MIKEQEKIILPPSELIALKKYYDEICSKITGCKDQKQVDAIDISKALEKRINDIAKNYL